MMEKKLPKGWKALELSKAFDINPGHKSLEINENIEVSFIPMTSIAELKNSIDTEDSRKYGAVKSGFTKFIEGDVLFAKITPCMENGKIAIASGLNNGIGCGTTELHVFRENGIYNNKLGYYYLIQNSFRDLCKSRFSGAVGHRRVPKQVFNEVQIPLPPLPEQKRIVAKLDALFGHLDKLREKLDRIPELLKNFRQQVLTQAVTGKLTEEFENKRILDEIRKDREAWYKSELKTAIKDKTKKPKKIVVKLNEDRTVVKSLLHKNYDVAFIEEIAAKKDYALKAGPFGSALKKEYYVPNGYKIYGQEQVIKGDSSYGDYYVNKEKYESLKSCSVGKGDILISLVGTIGRVLVIPEDFEPGIINPRLVKIALHEKISANYFSVFIKSPVAKKILNKMAHGGTMDVLNLGILKKLPIPIPSEEEQVEIVKRVEALFSAADKIEAQYHNLKEKIDRLPQAILAKAFKGELVAQNENDEPAGVLLERIKGEKDGKDNKGKEELRMVAEDENNYEVKK